ncbi:MAG: PhoX family phosphatase [Dehalococcoidia bacterium]|nr:PhoX family phosphatase [Dehalococcoidia bacterium]
MTPAPRPKNRTFADVLAARLRRRDLLRGAAAGLATAACAPLIGDRPRGERVGADFIPVASSRADDLAVPAGYRAQVLLRWGDPLFPGAPDFDPRAQSAARQQQQFGYDNDFIGYVPLPRGSRSSSRGLLGVNHENARSALMWPGWDGKTVTAEMVAVEIAAHGFTVVEVRRRGQEWTVVRESPYNRRITGATPMRLSGPAAGHPLLRTAGDPTGRIVLGTLNNCAGGVTPWGTFLTGEENIWLYFAGKVEELADPALRALHQRYALGRPRYRWAAHQPRFDLRREPNEPNRFGWVVEIDPYDPRSTPVKHTALGRMAHEGATVILSRDGRPVVYMGDDARFEYLYKFVADRAYDPGDRVGALRLLESGTLYAARFEDDGTGRWLPLVAGQGPLTAANGFPTQAEICINSRRAADLVGATKMDRPEDIEVHPQSGVVYAVMTNNSQRGTSGRPGVDAANPRPENRHGHIIEIIPDGDHAAATFRWRFLMICGDPAKDKGTYFAVFDQSLVSPISSPDNITFDNRGNLWISTDGQTSSFKKNDGVYAVPVSGPERGYNRQFLSGVSGAECASLIFSDNDDTLFVSIQHPAEGTTLENASSRFPDGKEPRPAVIFIRKEDGGTIGS